MRRGACLLDRWTALQSRDQPREAVPAEVARVRRLLLIIAVSSLLACLLPLAHMLRLTGGFLARYGYDEVFLRLVGASLALLSGAFLAAALIISARFSAGRPRSALEPAELQENSARRDFSRNWLSASIGSIASRLPARAHLRATLSGIPEALVMLAGAAFAVLLLTWRWPQPVEVELPSRLLFMRGAVLLAAAFPLLLAERAYAGCGGLGACGSSSAAAALAAFASRFRGRGLARLDGRIWFRPGALRRAGLAALAPRRRARAWRTLDRGILPTRPRADARWRASSRARSRRF